MKKYSKEILKSASKVMTSINQRCSNKNHCHYKNYGGRGIKNLLTRNEVAELLIRDKADKLKKKSIDRIDNDGHYEYSNCRFVELAENSRKRRNTERPNCPRGHLYSGENLYMIDNERHCRACARIGRKKYEDKKKREARRKFHESK